MNNENTSALLSLISQMNIEQWTEFMEAVKQKYCIDERVEETQNADREN